MTPLESFATRVVERVQGPQTKFDPALIAVIIAAVVEIAKMIRSCRENQSKATVLDAYNAWGPLGWLRRRRVASLLASKGLQGWDKAIVEEATLTGETHFGMVLAAAAGKIL